jgi:hypothetical protein
MHRVDALPHDLLGRLVQAGHGHRQAGADPGDHLDDDITQPGRIGAAHVAVPGRAD